MCKNSQDNEKKHENDGILLHSTSKVMDETDIDPQLLALLDQVCESGEDALPGLKAYMEETQAENAGSTHKAHSKSSRSSTLRHLIRTNMPAPGGGDIVCVLSRRRSSYSIRSAFLRSAAACMTMWQCGVRRPSVM